MTIRFGLAVLFVVWAACFSATWAAWGDVTIDSFREVYVPSELAAGRTLYVDVYYPYGPAAPYFNATLNRIFGIHLNVAFWAGSLSALAAGICLFLAGRNLGYAAAGLAAGLTQVVWAFVPGVFCFPLPYSFAAAYGCVVSCAFAATIPMALNRLRGLFLLGILAATGAALKMEFGAALAAAILPVFIGRAALRSPSHAFWRELAALLPGVLATVAVYGWMFSLRGVDFILIENSTTWPESYFMRQYGERWMRFTGASIDTVTLLRQLGKVGGFAVFWVATGWYWRGLQTRSFPRMAVPLAIPVFLMLVTMQAPDHLLHRLARIAILPSGAVFLAVCAGVWAGWKWWRNRSDTQQAAIAICCILSGLIGIRVLFGLGVSGYALYYAVPALLVLAVCLARALAVPQAAGLIGTAFLFALTISLVPQFQLSPTEIITTERGSIKVRRSKAPVYREAIAYISRRTKEGAVVASLPEDLSLYFLTGTRAPSRFASLTPGVLSPGRVTESYIQDFQRARVTDIVWSTRTFGEYGVPEFGRDFDKPVGDFIRTHYEKSFSLQRVPTEWWTADVWVGKRN